MNSITSRAANDPFRRLHGEAFQIHSKRFRIPWNLILNIIGLSGWVLWIAALLSIRS
jgi:hypothetical protein